MVCVSPSLRSTGFWAWWVDFCWIFDHVLGVSNVEDIVSRWLQMCWTQWRVERGALSSPLNYKHDFWYGWGGLICCLVPCYPAWYLPFKFIVSCLESRLYPYFTELILSFLIWVHVTVVLLAAPWSDHLQSTRSRIAPFKVELDSQSLAMSKGSEVANHDLVHHIGPVAFGYWVQSVPADIIIEWVLSSSLTVQWHRKEWRPQERDESVWCIEQSAGFVGDGKAEDGLSKYASIGSNEVTRYIGYPKEHGPNILESEMLWAVVTFESTTMIYWGKGTWSGDRESLQEA